jgi:hypothetical protein
MNYGYDTESKFLFSFGESFRFEGKVDSPPDSATLVFPDQKKHYEFIGCKFLSGLRKASVVAWSDGAVVSYVVCQYDKNLGYKELEKSQTVAEYCAEKTSVSLCGPVCRNPQKVAEFCRRFPITVNYVCPLVDELAAFGALVSDTRGAIPHRAFFGVPNEQAIDSEFVEFNKTLNADGLGRMAHLISMGIPVMNEMMTAVGISPFFGKMIHDGLRGSDVYIVRSANVNKLFPKETISVKNYAAIYVPVRVVNTKEFSNLTKCTSPTVDIFVTSEYVPGLPDFMRYYMVMTGHPFVGVAEAGDVQFSDRMIPVFRFNRGYRVSPDSMGKYDASRLLQSEQCS